MASLDVITDIENCFAGGWSDGLPVIPPYDSLVTPMLDALGWDRAEVVGTIATQSLEIRAEQIAATAVMAGCETAYGPVLRAVTEALLTPKFNLSGIQVTTGGVSALVVVSGSVAARLGFAHTANALGANARPNATVGRFAQLVRLFCGSGGGGLQEHGTVGHPGRISFCVAEHPETTWPDFHTQFGYEPGADAVSVMAAEGPNSVNNHYADSGVVILETIASCLAHLGSTNFYYRNAGYMIVLAPDHAALVTAEFTRADAQQFLHSRAVRPTEELIRMGRVPVDFRAELDVQRGAQRTLNRRPERFHFIETGAPGGKFSAVIPYWAGNRYDIHRPVDWSASRQHQGKQEQTDGR
jgi:hypothetical protein